MDNPLLAPIKVIDGSAALRRQLTKEQQEIADRNAPGYVAPPTPGSFADKLLKATQNKTSDKDKK